MKHASRKHRLLHMDGSVRWERKFAATLGGYGIKPAAGPVVTARDVVDVDSRGANRTQTRTSTREELVRLCRMDALEYVDNLAKGGNFWVAHDQETGIVAEKLKSLGCRYAHRGGVGAWYWSGNR